MISFNNIPDTIRTPGAYVEIDNSRALKGLIQNPHKVLIHQPPDYCKEGFQVCRQPEKYQEQQRQQQHKVD